MEATKISIKLIVDKKANKVILAKAGKEFVDFLFHLLSLPIVAVIGLLSSRTIFGCIGNLYKSIEDLDVAHLHANQHKDLLLKPKAPTTHASTSLPLLLRQSSPEPIGTLYSCVSNHRYVSDDKFNSSCPACGDVLCCEVRYTGTNYSKACSTREGGYVKGSVTFMVMDDLSVTPLSLSAGIAVLNKCNVDVLGERKVVE
ncbi:hypothetical protein CJ030_MR1G002644 [Morella rubra]|uniref:DUF674 domain-containing protein n=1 Tax=Morella rubra TaxID=262757 RepID=A0A6A1WNN4_9ROSI|nr:hypothetical protein CJ030_MR1G012157 [Morella rubra]KAB1226861.1 hypothetical protein CJ030_MR1G002644 [Morella rubra]